MPPWSAVGGPESPVLAPRSAVPSSCPPVQAMSATTPVVHWLNLLAGTRRHVRVSFREPEAGATGAPCIERRLGGHALAGTPPKPRRSWARRLCKSRSTMGSRRSAPRWREKSSDAHKTGRHPAANVRHAGDSGVRGSAQERPDLPGPPYLEAMTWTEVRDVIAAGTKVAIIPTGGTGLVAMSHVLTAKEG